MEDLSELVVPLHQHNGAGGVDLVAWNASQFPALVIHLVLAAGVKLPREVIHHSAEDTKRPNGTGDKESNTRGKEWGNSEGSNGRENRSFVKKVTDFNPSDALCTQARLLQDDQCVAMLQSFLKFTFHRSVSITTF